MFSEFEETAFSRSQLMSHKVFITLYQYRLLRRLNWREGGEFSPTIRLALDEYFAAHAKEIKERLERDCLEFPMPDSPPGSRR